MGFGLHLRRAAKVILTLLLSLPLLQVQETPATPSPVEAKASAQAEKQKWWDQLSEEERKEMTRRMRDVQSMNPDARKDLESRRKVFEQEKDFLLKQLSDEDRAAYEALDARSKTQFVKERVHERLRERGDHLRKRFPDSGKGRKGFEESRRQQVMAGIAKAEQEGWIGVRAKKHFETAPLHESMQALVEIQKWQFLEEAAENEFWKKNSVSPEHQRQLSGMPAQEFFREIRGLAEGRPMGPPRNRRDGRGERPGREGQGPPREGKREGHRPGEGPPPGPPHRNGDRRR